MEKTQTTKAQKRAKLLSMQQAKEWQVGDSNVLIIIFICSLNS